MLCTKTIQMGDCGPLIQIFYLKPSTFKSFQDKFKIKCNFLSYLQVISAIPKHLLHKAKSLDRRESLTTDKTTFPLTPSLNSDLYKMKCKDYYWLYINGTTCTAKGPEK